MDQHRFAALTRALRRAPSRRDVLRGLSGAGLGLGATRLPIAVEAKKKHKPKKKTKKAKPNAFGCFNVGAACKNAQQCCSGVCQGKKGERKCRAHGAGTCNQKVEGICEAPSPPNPGELLCNNNGNCVCVNTTAGSSFCAQVGADASDCADCKTDTDCEALGFPPGSACAPFTEGLCAGMCEGNMACLVPCGFVPPAA